MLFFEKILRRGRGCIDQEKPSLSLRRRRENGSGDFRAGIEGDIEMLPKIMVEKSHCNEVGFLIPQRGFGIEPVPNNVFSCEKLGLFQKGVGVESG